MQASKTLTERLNDNQATLWQLWRQRRHTESASSELLDLEKAAYQEHALLIKKVRRINKMNTPHLPRLRRRKLKRKIKQYA